MLVNDRLKWVYIPIPASMPYYVYQILMRAFPDSKDIFNNKIYGATPPLEYKNYDWFTVTLNPYIRQLLVWELLVENSLHSKHFIPEIGKSFPYFIEWGILQDPINKRLLEGSKFLYTQSEWFGDEKLDYFYHLETLCEDIKGETENDISNFEFPLDKKINGRVWTEYYDYRTEELLKLWCYKDFTRFDYSLNMEDYKKEFIV